MKLNQLFVQNKFSGINTYTTNKIFKMDDSYTFI